MRVWSRNAVVPTNDTQGLSGIIYNIDTILDDITIGESLNLSNQTNLLPSLLEAREAESMDLSAAVTELEKFKKVDFLSNYTLLDFDLDNPLSLSRFVAGAYVGLAFILMFFPIFCCCTCKCFRKAAQALIKNVFKFIWWVLKGLWQIRCRLVAYGRAREEEVLCAPDPEVSVRFNATDRDSTDTGAMSAVPGDEQLTFEMTQDFERRLGARRKVPRCWDRELEQRNSLAESSPRLRTKFLRRPAM
jgi:hypothetical protein